MTHQTKVVGSREKSIGGLRRRMQWTFALVAVVLGCIIGALFVQQALQEKEKERRNLIDIHRSIVAALEINNTGSQDQVNRLFNSFKAELLGSGKIEALKDAEKIQPGNVLTLTGFQGQILNADEGVAMAADAIERFSKKIRA